MKFPSHFPSRRASAGITAIEYALIISVLVGVVVLGVRQYNSDAPGFFNRVADRLGAGDPLPPESGGGGPGEGSGPGGGGGPGSPEDPDDEGNGNDGGGSTDPDPGSGGTGPGEPEPDPDPTPDPEPEPTPEPDPDPEPTPDPDPEEPGDQGGGTPGTGDGGSPTADVIIEGNIPYYWSSVFQDWFPRPERIPPADWNEQPYTIEASRPVAVGSGDRMSWNGVQLTFDTPARGETFEILLTISGHKVLYRFTRNTAP